jgi:hypothetical protein
LLSLRLMSAFHPRRTLAPRCATVRLSLRPPGFAAQRPAYSPTEGRRAWSKGKTIMQRIILACAASIFLTSPLRAQQAPPDQSIPEQTVPPAQSPPPSSQPASDLPPFAPPPPARLYDNYRPAGHHRTKANHRGTRHRHATAHHQATHRAVHASKRTIRRCHSMTYHQIMRHGSCRALIRQELKAPERTHHHASHHRSARHHRSGHSHRR